VAILNRTVNRAISRAEAPLTISSLRIGPVLLAVGAVIAVVGLLQLMQTSRATTASFKIEQLEQQKLELETSVSQLEVDVAGLSSLSRVQQEAQRLGLRPPAAREVVEVSVPGPTGDSTQIPARFLPKDEPKPAAGEQKSSPWHDLLKRIQFH
jgi:cell division protein FtsL